MPIKTPSGLTVEEAERLSRQQQIAPPISPEVPEAIVPEETLAGIRTVFGPAWTPSPAFTPELQRQGIFGAVRITGTPEVFTIGPGGRQETAESYRQRFGTAEQRGIVGEVTREQAIRLGISPAAITAPPTPAITPEGLAPQVPPEIPPVDITAGDAADILVAGAGEQVEQAKARVEQMIADITATSEELEKRGIAQLTEKEKRDVQAKADALRAATGQITIRMAEYQQKVTQLQAYEADIRAEPIATGYIAGLRSRVHDKMIAEKNSMAADVGLLQAQALVLQGDLTSAQNAANRAVDLKYSALEQRYENQKFLLGIYEGQWTEAEQIRADALDRDLDERKEALDAQKDIEKTIQSIMLEAAVAGASSDELADISASETVLEATQKASPYLREVVPTPPGPPPPEVAPLSEAEFKADFIRTYSEERKATPLESTVEKAWQEYSKEALPTDLNTTLYNVGLPMTVVTNKGKLTDTQLSKLSKGGIPPTDAQEIMNEILAGRSLEDIRQWMRSLGVDPQILDTFMQTLQETKAGTNLEKLLKELEV